MSVFVRFLQKSVVLPLGDTKKFLDEQRRSIAERFGELAKALPDPAPRDLSAHKCAKGHPTVPVDRAANCDVCSTKGIKESLCCRECDYDKCYKCTAQWRAARPSRRSVNACAPTLLLPRSFLMIVRGLAGAKAVPPAKVISSQEAKVAVLMLHLRQISQFWMDSVDYIEVCARCRQRGGLFCFHFCSRPARVLVMRLTFPHPSTLPLFYSLSLSLLKDMLRKQLIAAIGKEVTPVDFAAYMRFHNRRLFRREFEPRPFCHAIRRPNHSPEGTLSIEASPADGSIAEPIYTCCKSAQVNASCSLPCYARVS